MDSELKSFENQWESAMNNVTIPPPDIVWDNIEKELDKDKKRRGLFFWWKNPAVLSGIAAVLVLGLTVLFWNKKEDSKALARLTTPQKEIVSVEKPNISTEKVTIKSNENGIQNSITKPKTELNSKENFTAILVKSKKKQQFLKTFKDISGEPMIMEPAKPPVKENFIASNPSVIFNLESLSPKTYKTVANRFQPMRPYISVDFEEYVAENKVGKNKIWFGLNSGVAPFDPNFSTSGFASNALSAAQNDAAFTSKNTSEGMVAGLPDNKVSGLLPSSMPSNSFRNGRSINFGFSVGRKLKKGFGLETGLKVIQANAFLTSNVYAINQQTGQVNSFFQTNYLNSSITNTQTILSVNETTKQLYNYVNVPLLLNYALPISKYFAIEALGGMSGDMFVFGKFDASKDKLTASNSSFRLFNMSGVGGLRLNYKIANGWEANLGSTYQKALISGISNNENISFKPKMFGINYGLRYNLK